MQLGVHTCPASLARLHSSSKHVHECHTRRVLCRSSQAIVDIPSHLVAFRIRRARVEDSQAVGNVYSEVFGANNFPGYEDNPLIQQVEANYATAVGRESAEKLEEALTNKAQAALAARTYRTIRDAAMLKGQLLMAQGLPARFPTEGPNELRQLAKWKRARRFVCLVIEELQPDGSIGQILGTATISMMQAEAALPPPFPSNAPLRPYISNMAVAPGYRRQGLAKALVGACGRIARAWGEPCVLLHVAADNTAAQQMYSSCGFAPVPNSQGFSGLIKGPWTQQRMVADSAALVRNYFTRRGSCSSRVGMNGSSNDGSLGLQHYSIESGTTAVSS